MASKDGPRPSAHRLTQVKRLTERGKEVCRRRFAGEYNKTIQQALGITDVHIAKIVHSDVGKAFMVELDARRDQAMDEVVQRLKDLELKSVKVLELTHDAALLTKEDGTLEDAITRQQMCPTSSQIRAAERHLERQGYAQPPVATVLHKHLGSGQVLAELKQRAAAIAAKERKQLEQSPGEEIKPDGEVVTETSPGLDTKKDNL